MTHISAKTWAFGCLAAASLATALAIAPANAQALRGGAEAGAAVSAGQRGGAIRGGGAIQGGPRLGATTRTGIDARVRSGSIDMRRGGYVAGTRVGGAAPLTITRNRTYATNGGYYSGGRYYVRDRGYYDGGWFPGLLAAPFLLPGALLGAGYGYDYDYGYGPAYYPYDEGYYPAYSTPVGYPGPVSYGGEIGNFCATPQKTCQLYTPAQVGVGCSCRAPAGLPRFRGAVVP